MSARPNLRVVEKRVCINDLAREEIKARDWKRVHLEAEKNPPFEWWPRKWRWS